MKKDELMLKIENVSKIYRLGEIGGTTLREELQRLKARILHKEDPTKKIGAKNYNKGEKFKALDNISFDVKKGERIGIIGHNGAGKSTLLKLISRVTGPTDGKIYLNGRVASMLEVGTGFHQELTGRENVYMNGAILGMTKKEIDSKIEDIIEFSEVRQFIDTPVKRYSSGMYVKLAFSVAAHLDSEIMIMDEVLAVGDVAFQNKCIGKMKEVSSLDNRTILYVSHNMKTIKELCNRVIVLEKGKIIFDGGVDDGIGAYLGLNDSCLLREFSNNDREKWAINSPAKFVRFETINKDNTIYNSDEKIEFVFSIESAKDLKNAMIRFEISNVTSGVVGSSISNQFDICSGVNRVQTSCNFSNLASGNYLITIVLFQKNDDGNTTPLDAIVDAIAFSFVQNKTDIIWIDEYFGNVRLEDIVVSKENG